MLISCPNCKTTFAVAAKYIGNTGRKLKCSKCAHVWMQGPINFGGEMNSLLKVEKSAVNVPAVIKRKKLKFGYFIFAVILLGLSVGLELLKNPTEHPVFAMKAGIDDLRGLRFHNFKVDSEVVDNKLDFYIKGTIVNITDKRIKLPVIHVKSYSQGGRVMGDTKIPLEQQYLEPFSQIDISPEITRISGNAEKLELSFENRIEAILR